MFFDGVAFLAGEEIERFEVSGYGVGGVVKCVEGFLSEGEEGLGAVDVGEVEGENLGPLAGVEESGVVFGDA